MINFYNINTSSLSGVLYSSVGYSISPFNIGNTSEWSTCKPLNKVII